MRVLIISDVHSDIDNLLSCLKKESDTIDAVIFTGDGIDVVEDVEFNYEHIKFYKVRGNTDYYSYEESEKIIELNGYKIFITHGNEYGVKSTLGLLKKKSKLLEVDITIYGHTHISRIEIEDGIYYINGGCISKERISRENTYSIITLGDTVNVEKFVI